MFKSKARICITPKKSEHMNKYSLDDFIEFAENQDSTLPSVNLFGNAVVDTYANEKDKRNNVTGEMEELRNQIVSFNTKHPISDYDTFIKCLKVAKAWVEKKSDVPYSVEVKCTGFSSPLYLRDSVYQPPRTFYDLDMISETEQTLIEELNNEVNK